MYILIIFAFKLHSIVIRCSESICMGCGFICHFISQTRKLTSRRSSEAVSCNEELSSVHNNTSYEFPVRKILFTQDVHNILQTGMKSWHEANQKYWLHRNTVFFYCLKDYYLHKILWVAAFLFFNQWFLKYIAFNNEGKLLNNMRILRTAQTKQHFGLNPKVLLFLFPVFAFLFCFSNYQLCFLDRIRRT